MKRMIAVATASEFCEALENWIIDNRCNPTTPEEWNKCVEDMLKSGALTPVTSIDEEDTEEFKENLKENLGAKEL